MGPNKWLIVISMCIMCYPAALGDIGINYGQDANNLRSPAEVVSFLNSRGVQRIKLFSTQSTTMNAFRNSGIELIVGISNADVKSNSLGSSVNAALTWVMANISPYSSTTKIKFIAVGNEVNDSGDSSLTGQILQAMKNIRSALQQLGGGLENIRVSTPFSLNVLGTSYPPSQGSFADRNFMQPIVQFLSDSGSSFFVNIYPFIAYINNPTDIKLDYALLKSSAPTVNDPISGLTYHNLLEQQIDAVIAANKAFGYPNLPVVVTESGWPSAGGNVFTASNAQTYNQNLVNMAVRSTGTPMRSGAINAYIFALFNENLKGGDESERKFGLFYPDLTQVYSVNLKGT